jgi:hypothetical protein
MVRSEGNMSLKYPVTPPGIDPGTVRLVARRLNHYATPDPNCTVVEVNMYVYIHILLSVIIHVSYDYTHVRTINTLRFSSRMVMLLLFGNTSLHFTSLHSTSHHFTSLHISHTICVVLDMFLTTDSYDCKFEI